MELKTRRLDISLEIGRGTNDTGIISEIIVEEICDIVFICNERISSWKLSIISDDIGTYRVKMEEMAMKIHRIQPLWLIA